jgi:Leucine-rich repeat (LRR) protein
MPREFPRRRDLESLRKESKHWLAELRAGVRTAWERLERVFPDRRRPPTLRDVQLALAKEHGFGGWAALKEAVTPRPSTTAQTLSDYETKAAALLDAYTTGTPDAMERHYRYTWHRRAWPGMRTYVQLDLGKRAAGPDDPIDITLDDARYLIAIEHGFESWTALVSFVSTMPGRVQMTAKPVEVRTRSGNASTIDGRTREWPVAVRLLKQRSANVLNAGQQMTDAMLEDLSDVEHLTSIGAAGSTSVTDAGIRHLARLSNLQHLDLSGTQITDAGLTAIRRLRHLQTISLARTRVTDAGAAILAACDNLRVVNLSGTATGDRAIDALSGKTRLVEFRSGNLVTDAGLALLHHLPVFATWRGGNVEIGLTSYDARPNYLFLRGSFTDHGLRQLEGLDGLFALNIDDASLSIGARGLAHLTALPNLSWLAVDADDDAMPIVARMLRLRFLGVQDTSAGDDGFVALSRSQSIEYIWARRCHNLRGRGFAALAEMPVLRGLSVSCLNVDDIGVSALPKFPALKELMPMDVPDAGYRHVGACTALESLVLMYCRDTTDAATEQIVRLPNLTSYFNSYTTITDRTPELLSTMNSLERVTFDTCHGLTDAGIAKLARLPNLRELRVSGRQITTAVGRPFSASVMVNADE